MLNIKQLANRLELDDFINDLRNFGLSDKDIEGFLEFYGDTWVDFSGENCHDKN